MTFYSTEPRKSLWEEICSEFEQQKVQLTDDDDRQSLATQATYYDPKKTSPVVADRLLVRSVVSEQNPLLHFNPATGHPTLAGYVLLQKPLKTPSPRPVQPPPVRSCTPVEYLNHYVFPVLLPALEQLLKQAEQEKCFERKRTKFNAVDYLTEWMYRNNPRHSGRQATSLLDIPFVRSHLEQFPRKPLPMSLVWSDAEAALIIQAAWRGFLVRRLDEVQQLRKWQKDWRNHSPSIYKGTILPQSIDRKT